MKTFVSKLRPTPAQVACLSETVETCRQRYNHALSERKTAYQERGESIGFARQCASLPMLKREVPHLQRVHSQVVQDVVRRGDRAFQAFFRRVNAGEKAGYPRCKGRDRYDSFTYPRWGNGVKREQGRLVLSKIGALRLHNDRPVEGTPNICIIVRNADGWYAHIVCDVAPSPLPPTGKSVGIDVGLESFATLSNGVQIANPRSYRVAERTLKQAQRRLARRVKGSNRSRKARTLLANAHLKVKRARWDFAHTIARAPVNEDDHLAVEKLNIRGMVRNHPLAKSISDAGWGIFLNILLAKAARAGRVVVAVNPAGTSHICARCGESVPKRRAVHWHSCPYCGCELHRDHNAALTILKKCGGAAFGEAQPLGGPQNREPHRL
ncbi:RNA-guided endonuclease InsQ/TnpB family protein [Chloroflexus aggregans]|uniref:Transposase, IS605 OrfB family n=1 Tax=Chloroflexus aggregans (strain MD-66 / DSM 9485) TaxID=326427 RepID=B8G7S9_CHLAD|nr:RNA-guided endonuclease TnpB family protein [Chloroflexus aggregans]ACL24108.1 transposase, IS605 OrfB family [Chloroflexus aggregans DSM 9485]